MSLFQIDEIIESLHISKDTLNAVKGRMRTEMAKGLGKATNPTAKIKMFPTYVRSLPTGKGNVNRIIVYSWSRK